MFLRLKHEATVENAPKFAADAVALAKKTHNVYLDYSGASLKLVDDLIEKYRTEGKKSPQMAETLFGFGCYVGEVIVKHAGATWRLSAETKLSGIAGFALVLQTGPETFINPIAKVFKRMDNGSQDNLPYYYQSLPKPPNPS